MAVSAVQAASAEGPAKIPEKDAGAGEEARWRPVMCLPCRLTVDLPVPRFKVSDFLALRPGAVIGTRWGMARDVPLRINGTVIGWGELESSADRVAVRLTELA